MATRIKSLPSPIQFDAQPADLAPVAIEAPPTAPAAPKLPEQFLRRPTSEEGTRLMEYGFWLAQRLARRPWAPRFLNLRDPEDAAELARLRAAGGHRITIQGMGAKVEINLEGNLTLGGALDLVPAAYRADTWYPVSLGDELYEVHITALLAVHHADFPRHPRHHYWRPRPGSRMPWDVAREMLARGERLPPLVPPGRQHPPIAIPSGHLPAAPRPLIAVQPAPAPAAAPTAPGLDAFGLIDPLSLLAPASSGQDQALNDFAYLDDDHEDA